MNYKKEHKRDLASLEFDKEYCLNDYKFLLQKLKSINESITLLEKNFLYKEK